MRPTQTRDIIMKKLIVFIIACTICNYAYSQLSCGFEWLQDKREYFVIRNGTYSNYPITYSVVNWSRKEKKTFSVVVGAGQLIAIGPATIGWTWMKGEQIVITDGMGQSGTWTCQVTDPAGQRNVNFKANSPEDAIGNKCIHNISGKHKKNGVTKCPGFESNDRVWCSHCGCSYEAH